MINYKNQELNQFNVIGSDETGVGDYLTPIVACSTYVTADQVIKLQKIGVRDSKKLSDAKIKVLAKKIKPLIKYSVNHLTQKGYNNLNKMNNTHWIKMFLHLKGINYLEKKFVNVDYVVIDAFSNTRSMEKYENQLINNAYFKFKQIESQKIYIEKGETHSIAVAAASILARDFWLTLMDQQNQLYEIKFPFGANKKVKRFAIDFIKKHGREKFYQVAKIKFKTTAEIYEELDLKEAN